jgi:hypothetical protein
VAIKNGRQGKRAKNAQGKLSKGPQPRQDQAQRCANGHPTKTFSSGSISDAIRVLGGLQWSSASPAPAALEQVKADPDPLLILKPTPPQRIARPDVRVWTHNGLWPLARDTTRSEMERLWFSSLTSVHW